MSNYSATLAYESHIAHQDTCNAANVPLINLTYNEAVASTEEDLTPFKTSRIEYDKKRFILHQDILCPIRKEELLYVLEHQTLNIIAYNISRKAVIEDFSEEFFYLWENYAVENDRNLTKDAIDLLTYA